MKLIESLSIFEDSYIFQKIHEGTKNPDIRPNARANINSFLQALDKFQELLSKKIPISQWNDEIKIIQYPLNELLCYFSDDGSSHINSDDAFIFVSYIQETAAPRFLDMVREADADYPE